MFYRVKHREQLELQKVFAINAKKEQLKQKEVEKEERLEALREKVRVVAEADPYRLIKDTQVHCFIHTRAYVYKYVLINPCYCIIRQMRISSSPNLWIR